MSIVRVKITPKLETTTIATIPTTITNADDFTNNKTTLKQKRFKYTLTTFLERAHNIHGDKFDYSIITSEHINNGRESRVSLICKTCDHHWETTIHNHVITKRGCPNCAGNLPWTYDKFMTRAREVHGDKYNYDKILPEDIVNKVARIEVLCNSCQHIWSTAIHNHINSRQGCPKCAGCLKWNLELFIERAREIHGNKYDYSQITPDTIMTSVTRVPLECHKCQHNWTTSIDSHINSKSGCTRCADNYPWTFDEFVEEANILHENKYIYERLPGIINAYARINMKCTVCSHTWQTNINSHINCKSGCAGCAGTARWTHDKFISAARKLHGDKYDYSKIIANDIVNNLSIINIICRNCNNAWESKIKSHIDKKVGCAFCRGRIGENLCLEHLEKIQVPYQAQFRMQATGRHSYDFMLQYGEHKILIEFDGKQHFEFVPFFHKVHEQFLIRQQADVFKTSEAIKNGYKIIRIDYTQESWISVHIDNALKGEQQMYFSTPELYRYITDKLPQNFILA